MSYVPDVAFVMQLTASKCDLDEKVNQYQFALTQGQSEAAQLQENQTDPTSQQAQQQQVQQAVLSNFEKGIQVALQLAEVQQKSVTTQLESLQKQISQTDVKDFKTFSDMSS